MSFSVTFKKIFIVTKIILCFASHFSGNAFEIVKIEIENDGYPPSPLFFFMALYFCTSQKPPQGCLFLSINPQNNSWVFEIAFHCIFKFI